MRGARGPVGHKGLHGDSREALPGFWGLSREFPGARAVRVRRVGPGPYARPMQGTVHTFDTATGAGTVLLDDGTPLPFPASAFAASGLRMLRPGQRVRLRVEGEGAERAVVFLTIATLSDPMDGGNTRTG